MLQMQMISLFFIIAAILLAFSMHRVYSHRRSVGRARNTSKFSSGSKQGCTRKRPRRGRIMTDPIRLINRNAPGLFSSSLWQFMTAAFGGGNTLPGILTDAEFAYVLQHADTGDDPTSLAHWQALLQSGDFSGAPERGMYFDLAKLKQVADMVVAPPRNVRVENNAMLPIITVPEYH
tara:strand:+ start:1206 stop:1736 length:531 start_codon:yes stop_codon:yes gene_type:complete